MLADLAFALVSATAGPPLDFHCAAPLNHYGQVRQILVGPSYRISGEMHPVTLEEIPDPALPVMVVDGNIPSSSRSAGVMIDSEAELGRYVALRVTPRYALEGGERVADVDVQFRSEAGAEEQLRALGTIRTRGFLWEDLTFVIEAQPDRVTVRAGEWRVEVPVTLGPGAALDFSCIGGTYTFSDLVWGDLPPRTAAANGR